MTLYIVHRTTPGYAREDEGGSEVVGAYTDEHVAKNVAVLTYGTVQAVEVDHIYPGIRSRAKEFGIVLPD